MQRRDHSVWEYRNIMQIFGPDIFSREFMCVDTEYIWVGFFNAILFNIAYKWYHISSQFGILFQIKWQEIV